MSVDPALAALTRIIAERRAAPWTDVEQLTRWIYEHHYAHITVAPGPTPPPMGEAGDWSGGWRVVEILGRGSLLVARGGVSRIVAAGAYRRLGAARPADVDDPVELWVTDWSDHVGAGFRYHFGAEGEQTALLGRRRFYFNVQADARLDFAARLAAALRRSAAPFTLKAERDPRVRRRDGVVLYVDVPASPWTAIVIGDLLACDAQPLVDETSPFARRLAPGVAVADAPAGGESFGMHVSAAIADALLALETLGEPTNRLRRRLADRGVDISAPWRLHQACAFPIDQVRLP